MKLSLAIILFFIVLLHCQEAISTSTTTTTTTITTSTCPPPSTCPECQITSLPFQPELRNGGSASEGNLYVNGQPVCDDYWDNADARVTCGMLGYSSGFRTIKSKYGSVATDFIMDDVECDGDETTLLDC